MSDYLGNLIGKSFGQAAAVKPRRAPLFAPSPYVTGALAQAAALTPTADAPLLPSRRAWVATEAQPDSAANDVQEPSGRGQWFSVATDSITPFSTVDVPFTSPSGLQAAPTSAGTPISQSKEPEPSASDLSPAPRVRTRRERDSAGAEQTLPQHNTITPRSEGDKFDPSETPRRPRPSTIQGEQAQADLANQLNAQDRSGRSSDSTRASPPDMPPFDFGDPQRRSARARAAQEPRGLDRAPASEASVSRLAGVDQRSQPVSDLPGQGVSESHPPQRLSSIADAAANGSRLATIRTAVPIAPVTTQMQTDLTPGETRPVPVSAVHPLSPARLTGALVAQPAPLQSAPNQQAIPGGPTAGQETPVIRPALRSAQQGASGEPWPAATRTSARAGAGSDNASAPVQPTIHVTIGRIEVRATPPPSAPARKQTAAPVMSLDEYLKTRSGGQR